MKNRIVGFERVKASTLIENRDNARMHPKEQREAMTGLLTEIGMADAVIVRKVAAGYELLDGHMRRELLGDRIIPVVIVDLNDEEAASFMLTFDAVKGLAKRDHAKTNALLDRVLAETGAVRQMLNEMSHGKDTAAAMKQGMSTTRARTETLRVGKFQIMLSNEENSRLTLQARKYAETTGSYLNFVQHLLDRIKKNRARPELLIGGTEGG